MKVSYKTICKGWPVGEAVSVLALYSLIADYSTCLFHQKKMKKQTRKELVPFAPLTLQLEIISLILSRNLFSMYFSKETNMISDKFSVYITCDHDTYGNWKSDTTTVSAKDILYGKVIRYQVPTVVPRLQTPSAINVVLHLECCDRNQYCSYNFIYSSYGGRYLFSF